MMKYTIMREHNQVANCQRTDPVKRKEKVLFACFVLLLTTGYQSHAQMVNGNGFLQQNRVEVGVANNGSYGTTENAPAGYHPRCWPITPTMYNPANGSFLARLNALGFVADYDTNGWNGLWTVSPPPYIGDYFLPGTPQEGWAIEIDGQRCNAFCSNYTIIGSNGYFGGNITGVSQYVSNTGGLSRSFWEGNYNSLNIKQVTTLRKQMLYFTGYIKLRNTGTDTMKNVYYMRTLDPDNDVSYTLDFDTHNKIVHKIPNADNIVLVSSVSTANSYAYLGLGTIDCRAKPFIRINGLIPPTDSLAYLFSGTHPALLYSDSLTADVGVGIIYKVGTLPPGDSAELHFAYVLQESMLDAALDEIKPQVAQNGSLFSTNDTLLACTGAFTQLNIVNGSQFSWTWTSIAPLSNTSGTSTNVMIGSTPVTVTAIGSGICNDTLHFYLLPTSTIYTNVNGYLCNGSFYHHGVTYNSTGIFTDTISGVSCDTVFMVQISNGSASAHTINEHACTNNGYSFNGTVLYTSGIYHDTLINYMGCDSFITLNLTIHPLSITNITDSSCSFMLINGVTYTQSGTFMDTLSDSYGCDSILILHLTITQVNAGFVQTGTQLTASPGLATYQWLTCFPYQSIPGAISQVYLVGSDGIYAVAVNLNGCKDTSQCVSLFGTDIVESSAQKGLLFYPNPVTEMLQISSFDGFRQATIRLFSAEGKLVSESPSFTGKTTMVDMRHLTRGFYTVEITENHTVSRKKVCKADK